MLKLKLVKITSVNKTQFFLKLQQNLFCMDSYSPQNWQKLASPDYIKVKKGAKKKFKQYIS